MILKADTFSRTGILPKFLQTLLSATSSSDIYYIYQIPLQTSIIYIPVSDPDINNLKTYGKIGYESSPDGQGFATMIGNIDISNFQQYSTL